MRHESAVLVLFLIQAVARGRMIGTSATPWAFAVWAVCCVALLLLLAPSWRRQGVWVLLIGMALNLAVVLANGGMPLEVPGSTSAIPKSAIASTGGFYLLAGQGTVLASLGDALLVGTRGYRLLLSAGDVLLAIGVSTLIVDAMLNPQDADADPGQS